MKLLLTVSALLCVFVVMVSSAAISPERSENVNTAIDKLDEKAVSRLSRAPSFPLVPVDRHCTRQGKHCSSRHPRCCRGLSCISHYCRVAAFCLPLNQSCRLGLQCCGSLECIHGVCKIRPSPTPSPRPVCTTGHCGPSHPPCCNSRTCHHGNCILLHHHHGPQRLPSLTKA